MSRMAAGILSGTHAEKGGILSKLIFLILLIFVFAILYFARHPLLRAAGDFWIVDETPQVSDVIVILTGDNYDADRASRGAALYKSGMAPRVVATGKALRSYASSTDLMKRDLVERGVPAPSVDEFTHREDDTRDEALALTEFIASHKWKKILLVTSNYHTRRAKYIFERTLPQGSQLRVVSAPDSEYDPNNWWRSRRGVKIFFDELFGSLVAIWDLRHYDVQTSSPARPSLVLNSSQHHRFAHLPPFSPSHRYTIVSVVAAGHPSPGVGVPAFHPGGFHVGKDTGAQAIFAIAENA